MRRHQSTVNWNKGSCRIYKSVRLSIIIAHEHTQHSVMCKGVYGKQGRWAALNNQGWWSHRWAQAAHAKPYALGEGGHRSWVVWNYTFQSTQSFSPIIHNHAAHHTQKEKEVVFCSSAVVVSLGALMAWLSRF